MKSNNELKSYTETNNSISSSNVSVSKVKFDESVKSKFNDAENFMKNHKKGVIYTVAPLIAGGLGIYGSNKFLNSYHGIKFTSSLTNLNNNIGNQNGGLKIGKRFLTGSRYVFKIVNTKFGRAIENEVEACEKLRKCKDKRIKAPICYEKNSDRNCIFVSEFAPGMGIEDYAEFVSKCDFKTKLIKTLQLTKQFCEIYWELAKHGVVHSDISHEVTGNFVINEEKKGPVIYIFDFGRSDSLDNSVQISFADFPSEGISIVAEKILGLKLDGKTHPTLKILKYLNKNVIDSHQSNDVCMRYPEVECMFQNNYGNRGYYISKEIPPKFIEYLNKKISEVKNMNDDEINTIGEYINAEIAGHDNDQQQKAEN